MELKDHVKDFETFLTGTQEARQNSERDHDYENHKQWSDDEVHALDQRGQAAVVINRIKTKVNLLTGVQRQRRSDPKALPRTPKHEDEADSITDAIRFVADNTEFEITSSGAFKDKVVWGYTAAIVDVEKKKFEIGITKIDSDRLYFDPYSRRLDFKDGRYMGIVIWMDEAEGIEMFPGKAEEIKNLITATNSSTEETTFEDKPRWIDRERKRFRVCQHYYVDRGKWYECFFTEQMYLVEPKPSPYLDEHGEPTNPIEAQTAYIDRDNNRYGEVRQYIWPQQELNHRRSKALYNLSTRQTLGEKGAVNDVRVMKQELAKANGHVEINPGKHFEVLNNADQTQGHLELYQDAKNDIDTVGANAALSGTHEQALSGRAIQAMQQGGIAELGALFDGHAHWERRIYRQIWARIKQFWNEERWIRVTDNEDNLKWVQLNQPVTAGQILTERAQAGDQNAQAMLQQMLGDPRLNQVVEVRNNTTELDVDIILTQALDYATIRQEQFQMLAELAKVYGPEAVPFEAMLRLSDMVHKKEVEELLHPKEQEVDPEQQKAQQELAGMLAELEFQDREATVKGKQADVSAKEAKIRKDLADAEAQEIENAFVREFGLTPDGMKQSLNVSTGA